MEQAISGPVKVDKPMIVRTKNSVFRVEPVVWGKYTAYKITKIEELSDFPDPKFPVGWEREGAELFLDVGSRMVMGDFLSSPVVEIMYVGPHH